MVEEWYIPSGMTPDLDKLRRFALVIGVILFTYSVAAVELDTAETIKPLGLPLKINDPMYLGIGLVIASLWGMGRFLYYGAWKKESPGRIRRNELAKLFHGLRGEDKPRFQSEEDAERYADNFRELFPRLPGFRTTATTEPVVMTIQTNLGEAGAEYRSENEFGRAVTDVKIPFIFHLAARIEDADYFAPFWVNILALVLWLYRVFVGY